MKNSDHIVWQNSEFGVFLNDANYEVLQYFKSAVQDESNPIIAFDMDAKIMFINSSAANLLVPEGRDVIGIPVADVFRLIHGAKPGMDKYTWEQLIRDGLLIGVNLERTVKSIDEQNLPVMLTGSPIFDQAGFLVGGVFQLRENHVN